MAFNTVAWEFSNVTTEEVKYNFPKPEEGDRYLKITDASFDDGDQKYTIMVTDLGNEASFSLSYWLSSFDENNTATPNVFHRNTLVSLGKALAGKEIGIPAPESVIGGVILAHITLKPSKKDPTKKYARCSKFEPVSYDMAVLADIDQYYTDEVEE